MTINRLLEFFIKDFYFHHLLMHKSYLAMSTHNITTIVFMLVTHVTSQLGLKDPSLNFWLAKYIITSSRYQDETTAIVNHR